MNKTYSDFDPTDLETKMMAHFPAMLDKVTKARDYFKSTLVFCSSVAEARRFAREVAHSESVDGKTPDALRDATIKRFKDGTTPIVFNVGVLTTGFDHPELDCIMLARATKSLTLYYQMLGRGVRIAEGKTHCSVMDFSGTIAKMGQIETIELHKEKLWELYTTVNGVKVSWHNKVLYSRPIDKKNQWKVDQRNKYKRGLDALNRRRSY